MPGDARLPVRARPARAASRADGRGAGFRNADAGEDAGGFSKTDELPFDFERRRLPVVVEKAGEPLLITKGAPESVLAVCTAYELEEAVHPLDADMAARCLEVFRTLSARGLRVLSVAERQVSQPCGLSVAAERELTLVGFLTFADHLLEGAAQSIERLRRDGVEVKILTGDNELVTRDGSGAHRSRRRAGSNGGVCNRSSRRAGQIFAPVSPAQKRILVELLKR
jgi:Mg2+-importing ATPase